MFFEIVGVVLLRSVIFAQIFTKIDVANTTSGSSVAKVPLPGRILEATGGSHDCDFAKIFPTSDAANVGNFLSICSLLFFILAFFLSRAITKSHDKRERAKKALAREEKHRRMKELQDALQVNISSPKALGSPKQSLSKPRGILSKKPKTLAP